MQPQALRVGQPPLLSFAVTRDDRPVKDLEPYLGASATSWLSDAATWRAFACTRWLTAIRASSLFMPSFQPPGSTRLFLQFAHAGSVHTADFETRVEYP